MASYKLHLSINSGHETIYAPKMGLQEMEKRNSTLTECGEYHNISFAMKLEYLISATIRDNLWPNMHDWNKTVKENSKTAKLNISVNVTGRQVKWRLTLYLICPILGFDIDDDKNTTSHHLWEYNIYCIYSLKPLCSPEKI